jgi:clan AA aspartic protease
LVASEETGHGWARLKEYDSVCAFNLPVIECLTDSKTVESVAESYMGQFSVRVIIAHPTDTSRQTDVELLVDTGATLSWVPREVLDQLGVPRLRRRSFLVADGRTIERETAGAIVLLDGSEANVTVVVAEPGDGSLLGATTLESLGFAVDPIRRQLVPQELLAM